MNNMIIITAVVSVVFTLGIVAGILLFLRLREALKQVEGNSKDISDLRTDLSAHQQLTNDLFEERIQEGDRIMDELSIGINTLRDDMLKIFDDLDTRLDNRFEKVYKDIDNYSEYVSSHLKDRNNELDGRFHNIDSEYSKYIDQIENKFTELNKELDRRFDKVYKSITGREPKQVNTKTWEDYLITQQQPKQEPIINGEMLKAFLEWQTNVYNSIKSTTQPQVAWTSNQTI